VSADLVAGERILRARFGARLAAGFPMATLTTFRIGGPAALFVEPEDDDDLAAAGRAVVEAGLPFVVLGKGSNVLVADEGFPGLVLRLGRGFRWAARQRDDLTAGGAMPLPALAGIALRHSLAGLEFGVAIPASLGGAVRMNAGAHGAEMSNVLRTVDLYRLRLGDRETVGAATLRFAYRSTAVPEDAVVVAATVGLGDGDPAEIRARMDEARAWRRRTQPLAEPNCGSVFKNPEGDHAARLIDEAGMKGASVGRAHVSEKHANFIVADPGARAGDVTALIDLVTDRVRERSGVILETEVQVLGGVRDAA
jgi:UDP-N-acetylmuramate dehydrogenase